MQEAFARFKATKENNRDTVSKEDRFSIRDWFWFYPANIFEFFKKAAPLSFILLFGIFGVFISIFLRSDTLANFMSSQKSDIFVEGSVGAISSLNPIFTTQNPVDSDLQALVFEKFISISNKGEPIEGIAIEWFVSSDGKTYDFTISNNHTWQDGEPLTMEDILYTFETAKQLSSKYNYDTIGSSMLDVEIKKISDDKIRFVLSETNSTFFEAVSVYIVPKHRLEDVSLQELAFDSFSKYPLGSGPYEVYRSEPNVVYLQASDYFWITLKIETFIYRLYSDYDSLEAAFRNGTLDAMGGVNTPKMLYIEEYSRFVAHTITLDSRLRMIFFNTRKEKLESAEVRRALNYLMNKEELLDETNIGGELSYGPIAESSWAYSSEEVERYEYNPQKAEEILKNLGYTFNQNTRYYETEDKKVLSFSLSYYDNDYNNILANTIKELYQEEGLVLNLDPLSYTQLTQEIVATRDFELLMYEVETTIDPDQYNLWHSLKSNYPDLNLSGYSYERVDILLEDARRKTDQDERKGDYELFQRYLTQDSPAIFLYHPNYTYVVREDVKISDISEIAYPYQRFQDISYWSK